MKDFPHLASRLLVAILTSALSACVVVPEKVTSYDSVCNASRQKIELTTEQIEVFDVANCLVHSCTEEIISALAISTLAFTTSTVVSGSVALVGNSVYWLESQQRCAQKNQQPIKPRPAEMNENHIITEKIITAKS
ncbi:MAG TPA: hypothetical protein VLC79_05855 [Cellvibrio sp.]|nr:hypothetical protein [Cellvibrio sp.]